MNNSDTLILFDLTQSLTKPLCQFDFVVSSNTLSHIHTDFWKVSLTNLVNFVVPTGTLFLNLPNCEFSAELIQSLRTSFIKVDFFYYTSHSSVELEKVVSIASTQELSILIEDSELRVPNKSEFGQQIMVIASFKIALDDFPALSINSLQAGSINSAMKIIKVQRWIVRDLNEFIIRANKLAATPTIVVCSDKFALSQDFLLLNSAYNENKASKIIGFSDFVRLRSSDASGLSAFRRFLFIGTETVYLNDAPSQKAFRENFNWLRSKFHSVNTCEFITVYCQVDTFGNDLYPTDFALHG